jgi:hypothetical protein
MAHANLHMAAGMVLGTAITVIPLARAWLGGAPLARPVGRMLLAAYAVGIWAIVPNLVSAAGGPAGIHHAVWSNVFVGHALIDRKRGGGLLIGELVMVAVLVFQYAVLVLALVKVSRRGRGGSRSSGSGPAAPSR